MRTQLTKIALSATLGFALAFTISCSSDDDNKSGGGWLRTCEEFQNFFHQCNAKYTTEYSNCQELITTNPADYNACLVSVDEKVDDCVTAGACNGTSFEECKKHYDEEMGC